MFRAALISPTSFRSYTVSRRSPSRQTPAKRPWHVALFVLCIHGVATVALADGEWRQLRGPGAAGVAPQSTNLPTTWSTSENIAWKTDIPGRGWSSPIVTAGRVFFTTVVNKGELEDPKKGLYFGGNRPKPTSDHEWFVTCLDLMTGDLLWNKKVHEGVPQTAIHVKSSFASETPVTDGEYVYVLFGGLGMYCFDLEGELVWEKPIEPKKTRYGWGYAASPILHKDRLYVVNDNDETSYLAAYDKRTGEEIWKIDRDEKSNWSTPFLWENESRTEIVTPGSGKVRSYDLNGNLLWSLKGMSSITIATPYAHRGLLFVSSGYVGDKSRPLYAIRPGAEGDISLLDDETSNEFIAWSHPQGGPYNPSTIGYDGIIYVLLDRGMVSAYDATDGSQLYSKKRLPNGRAFTSSPWAYDGKIFCLNEDGKTFALKAGGEFEVSHVNELEEDDMGMASPAMVGDRLIVRTAARVYCIKNQ